jgi:ketosteroid isomerase-like protein
MATKAAADVAKIIKANNKALCAELANGNAAGIAKMYAKGAKLMPPNADFMQGKTLTAFWDGAIKMGIKGGELKSKEVEVFGNTANEVGTYTLYGADKTAVDNGKYIVIWRKEGKTWKLYRDIFNSNRAAS